MFKEINGAVLPECHIARFQCFMCMKSFKELISPRTGTFLRSDSVDIISLVLGTFPVCNLFAL